MMNCDNARPMLQNLLEGLLTPKEEASLGKHLSACTGCRREKSLLALGVSGLILLPHRRPSAGFDGRVLAAATAARRRVAPSRAAVWALNAAVSATALWMAALAVLARPRLSVATALRAVHFLRHPAAIASAAELKLAAAGLSFPEGLRAARHSADVLSRIHFVSGSAVASLALQFVAAAVIAGFAVAAAAKPRTQFAASRRTR
jgi:hypothetical protein